MSEDGFRGPIRKVVMGHDADGRTVVLSDAPARTHGPLGAGTMIYDIWETVEAPTPIPPQEPDPGNRPLDYRLPDKGIRMRIADYPPSGGAPPFMHRTETVDVVMVLRGELTMEVEGGEDVVLRAGDTLVQRATIHAWVNRSSEPCRVMFLMIGGRLTEELKQILGVEKLDWDPAGSGRD